MFMMKNRSSGFVKDNIKDNEKLPACNLGYWYPGQVFFYFKKNSKYIIKKK